MKNYFKILIVILLVGSIVSCGKGNSNTSITAASVKSDASNGTWKLTFVYRDSVNLTADFAGYNFTFNQSGIVNAANSLINNPGNWATSDANGSVKFLISFTNPASFVRLNNTWTVVSSTGSTMRFIGTSTNGSLSDQLLFEKI